MAYKYIINNKKVSAHSKQTLFPNEIDKIMIFFAKRKLKILSYLCDLDHFWKTNAYLSQKCLNISKNICAQYGTHVTIPKTRLFIR